MQICIDQRTGTGFLVLDNGQGTVEECDIFGNASVGLDILRGSNPIIRKCQIHDGKQDGVYVQDNGQGTVEECDIFGNAHSGVQIEQSNNPLIRQCRINRNGNWAVRMHRAARLVLKTLVLCQPREYLSISHLV